MGMIYTYDTRNITRDFRLLKPDGKACTKSKLPPGVHCIGCQFYDGEYTPFDKSDLDFKYFIKCKLPDIDDHPSAKKFLWKLYQDLENQALSALSY